MLQNWKKDTYPIEFPNILSDGKFYFTTDTGVRYEVGFGRKIHDRLFFQINFNVLGDDYEDNTYGSTNKGEQYKVMATIVKIVSTHLEHIGLVHGYEFSGEFKPGNENQETSIRTKLFYRYATHFFDNSWNVWLSGNVVKVRRSGIQTEEEIKNLNLTGGLSQLNFLATKSTPKVYFSPREGIFSISGDSFPENARTFYNRIIVWWKDYLNAIDDPKSSTFSSDLTLRFEMNYINSTSTKYLLELMTLLADKHKGGLGAHIIWQYPKEDEDLMEMGLDFKQRLKLPFDVVESTEDILIAGTEKTPILELSLSKKYIRIEGNSFPPNAYEFYSFLLNWVKGKGKTLLTSEWKIELKLEIFNTSTSRTLMHIFAEMEEVSTSDNPITIDFYFADEEGREEVEEMIEPLEGLNFNLILKEQN